MADTAAASLAGRPISRLIASPLQRTQESAAPWSTRFDLEIATEPRVIEPWNKFEGTRVRFGPAMLRQPELWRWVSNPFQPSWGEPYVDIAARMLAAIVALALLAGLLHLAFRYAERRLLARWLAR